MPSQINVTKDHVRTHTRTLTYTLPPYQHQRCPRQSGDTSGANCEGVLQLLQDDSVRKNHFKLLEVKSDTEQVVVDPALFFIVVKLMFSVFLIFILYLADSQKNI